MTDVAVSRGTIVIRGTDRPSAASWSCGHRVPRPDLGFDDGAWASWDWDGTTLTARTCPNGSVWLYYAVFDDGIAISSSIHDVLAAGVDRTLDWAALSVLLRLDFFMANRTPFAAIRILPPGAHLEWSAGRLSLSSRPLRPPVEKSMTFDAAVDAYLDLAATAVRRRAPSGPFVMPLSGGRDSRHIFLELLKQGHRPALAVTSRHYLLDVATDVMAASTLAARVNVPHEILSVPSYSLARQDETCRRSEFNGMANAWALTLADRLRECRIAYEGHSGSLYGRARYATRDQVALARSGRYDELVDGVLAPTRWIDHFLAPDVREKLSSTVAAAEIRTEMDRFRAWPNPCLAYWYWNRNRRRTTTIPFLLLRSVPTMFAPLDDYDLVEFALSLPPEVAADRRWQPTALRRGFPEVADVPLNEELGARPPQPWYTGRERHLHRSKYAFDLLRILGTRGSELIEVKRVTALAASTWLVGRGRHFETLPPLVTYLLALEHAANRTRRR